MNGQPAGKKRRPDGADPPPMRKHRVRPTVTDQPGDGDKKPPKRKKPASPGPVEDAPEKRP